MSDTAAATGDPAAPRARTALVLSGHVIFTLLHSVLFSNMLWLVPMLVRLKFGAADPQWRDWQTTFVTAAVPTFLMFSIFWGELLRRIPLRSYLAAFWLSAALPLGCAAFVQEYWQLLACHVLTAFGFAGWAPVNGQLLKHFYSDAVRGRMFSMLNIATLLGAIGSIYFVGDWLEKEPDNFRPFFIVTAAMEFVGVLLLIALVKLTGADQGRQPSAGGRGLLRVLQPVVHMRQVLKADRTFLRYEQAFMTYGAAYMLCEALLPIFATVRFDMRYEEYAYSTQLAHRSAMLLLMLPMGFLLDRLGPVRISGLAFGVLGFYPVLLLLSADLTGVATASAVWGAGLAGVMMGWTLGPVTLAGSAEKVPQYSAIHATMVGIRGVLFQGFGMLLYQLTGGFAIPLLLSAAAFFWASVQMWQLHGALRLRPRPTEKSEPATLKAQI